MSNINDFEPVGQDGVHRVRVFSDGERELTVEQLTELNRAIDPQAALDEWYGRDDDEVDATAAAREEAAESDVDLSEVAGTGKDGRVTKQDVLDAEE